MDAYKALLKKGCPHQRGTVFVPSAGIIAPPNVIRKMGPGLEVPRCNHPGRIADECSSSCPAVKGK